MEDDLSLPNYHTRKTSRKKYLVALGIVVFLLISVYFKFLPKITGNLIKLGECPYECCTFGLTFYEIKKCPTDYTCKKNTCVEKDSDGDGLSDIKEKDIGTNPLDPDSDKDGLNDFKEVNYYHTNPTHPNSDCDRYIDGKEVSRGSDPNKPNTAVIEVYKSEERGEYNMGNLIKDGLLVTGASVVLGICSGGSFGVCAASAPAVGAALSGILNDVVYTTSTDISFTNIGDDYTSFVSYEIVYYAGSGKIRTEYITEGRLNVDGWVTKTHRYEILFKNIPTALWNFFTGKNKITINVENLNYEKYPIIC